MPQLISIFNIQPLASALASQALCLTPNQRLASRITNAYAIYCQQHGHSVVAAPSVSSFNQWLDTCWERLIMLAYPKAIAKQLLTAEEQRLIIERIIVSSVEGELLLRPSATAQHVVKAQEHLSQWLLDVRTPQVATQFNTEDSQCLLQWLNEYEGYCAEQNYLSPSHKPQIILEAFSDGTLPQIKNVITTAFETLTPLQNELLNTAAINLSQEDAAYTAGSNKQAIACVNYDQEIMASAVWAKRLFKDTLDPQRMPTIGIVVPDLTKNKEKVRRIFEQVFTPELQRPETARKSLPFNISAGSPMMEQPVVQTAIKLLELSLKTINCDELCDLLNSPFTSLDDLDLSAVTQLINYIRQDKAVDIKVSRLRSLAKRVADYTADEHEEPWHFSKSLQAHDVLSKRMGLSKEKSAEQWVDYFYEVFELYQWPGKRNPDSQEYQTLQQLQSVLLQFVQSGEVVGDIGFYDALQYLKRLLSNAVFQPQTLESPLQILGVLEASGLHFDYLWLMGMSSKQWPSAPSPNPLLPIALQKQYNMPNATASRELSLAKDLSERFARSAGSFYVSYSQIIDDNACSISPIFTEFEQITPEQLLNNSVESLLPQSEIYRRYQELSTLEEFDWGRAPVTTEDEKVKGGTSLFANQSLCPFKAFATHRLGLKAFEKPVIGIDKAARGNLLHRSLELIWKQISDSEQLQALVADEQSKLCSDYAEFSLNEYSHKLSEPLGLRHHRVESKRLAALLNAWLNVERTRAAFTVVSTEEKKTFRFAQLELVGRVDRVDSLSDGSQVIIDYKTGKPAIKSWWGDRPDQPQLPLYSTLLEQEGGAVSAVAFAQVNLESSGLKGIGDDEVPESPLRWNAKAQSQAGVQSWQELKVHWQKVLSSLANDFINGECAVDPKNTLTSCQYCDLAAVCRVNHQAATIDRESQANA